MFDNNDYSNNNGTSVSTVVNQSADIVPDLGVFNKEKNEENLTENVFENLTYNEKIFVIVLYSLISLTAVCGNGVVLYLIVRFRRLRTPTNYLIANLASADLSMALLCIPFSYWPYLILGYWPFGFIPCKLINFFQAVTVMCSAYTLVAISLDRFTAVLFPLKATVKLTKAKALCSIGLIWFGSIIIACPLLVVLTLTRSEQAVGENVECSEVWADPNQGAAYSVALMVVQYFVPLIVLVLTYAGIGAKLWYSRVPGEGNSEVNTKRQDSVRKMIPTMVIVTSVFAVCWLPQNVLIILDGLYESVSKYPHIQRVWWACHMMAMSHTVFNPIIYVLRNSKFRLGFCFVARFLPFVHYDGSLHDNKQTTVTMATSYYSNKPPVGKRKPSGGRRYFNGATPGPKPCSTRYIPIENGASRYRTSCID